MRKIIILLILLSTFLTADVVNVTLKDFVIMISKRFHKTVLIDKSLDTSITLISSEKLDFIYYFGMVIDVLDDNDLAIVDKYEKYYYITKKKAHKKLLNIKNIDLQKLNNLANLCNVKVFQLDKTSYIIEYKNNLDYKQFSNYVKQLDFSKTLRISGVIYKTDNSKLKSAGIDVSVLLDSIKNSVLFNNSSFSSLPFEIRTGENKIQGFLRYLSSKDLLKVITRPDFVVLSGKKADFFAGLNYPIKKSTTTNLNSTTPLNSVNYDYIKTGLNVKVTPNLIDSNKVHLKISFNDSHITALDSNKNVVTSENRYSSDMIVELNKTIIIAGMQTDEIINRSEKIPVLGDIWLLKTLFSRNSKNLKTSNYIFTLKITLE